MPEYRTINGRCIGREMRPCPLTRENFAAVFEADTPATYRDRYDADRLTTVREVATPGSIGEKWTSSPSQIVRDLEARIGANLAPSWPWPRPTEGLPGELLKLADLGLPRLADELAGWLGVESPGEADGIFPIAAPGAFPGIESSRSIGSKLALPGIGPELLTRHRTGDFGLFGSMLDAQLDDNRRWAPQLFGRSVQNADAIESGHGVIHSRYGVTGGNTQKGDVIDILTLLVPGRTARTLMWCPRLDGGSI